MRNAEEAGLTTRKHENAFEEIMNAVGDSISDLASSDNEENGEDEADDKEDTELGKLSEDDKPSWVMGAISKTVQQHMESIWQKQRKLSKLMQKG